ncbi:ATP-binding protein [Actinokineospora sp.]|uniref:ATP-binding protein n=1 Tax=Actinokineospora sp. TaxID=1872133 RepID=UPI00403765F4
MGDQSGFGVELRRLRLASGLSLSRLAERIHYSKGYLSKVENGVTAPNRALAALCELELGTNGSLIDLVPADGRRQSARADGPPVPPSGLPAVTPHFTGRLVELKRIRDALLDDPAEVTALCAVNGMAGVGKTALAVRSAHRLAARFTDGCLYLDLRGHSESLGEVPPDEALDRFLRVLGVSGQDVPPDTDDRAAMYRDRLRGKRMLIVLDNARSARQVIPLLPAEPRCRVLVTSRHRLNALDDACHVALGQLSSDEGVSLFRSVVSPDRSLVDGDPAVRSIVDRCGYLPLAIRIAAARFRANDTWTTADLARRLADQAVLLTELDDGERSVAGAFLLSYRELPADQRRMFGLLALYPGADIDARSAGALADIPLFEAERLLCRLLDAHLVIQHALGRFQFHDLLRVFAQAHALTELAAADQAVAVRRLLDYSLHAAELADIVLTPHRHRPALLFHDLPAVATTFVDSRAALAWLIAEWPNLVALCGFAAGRGAHDRCWQLAFTLRGFFFFAKLWDPWIETHLLAVGSARIIGDRWAQAASSNNLGIAHGDRGDLDAAATHYSAALALFREIGDEHGTADALANYAWIYHYRGEYSVALENLTRALEFYEQSMSRRNVAITLRGVSLVQTELGEYDEAIHAASRALGMFHELGLELDAAMALNCLGWTHFRAGDYLQAVAAYRQALAVSDGCGSRYESARAQTGLGNAASALGQTDEADRCWRLAHAGYPDFNPLMVGESRVRLAVADGLAPSLPSTAHPDRTSLND